MIGQILRDRERDRERKADVKSKPTKNPEPKETDPKPETAPWPGDDTVLPNEPGGDTYVPLVR